MRARHNNNNNDNDCQNSRSNCYILVDFKKAYNYISTAIKNSYRELEAQKLAIVCVVKRAFKILAIWLQ